MATLYRKYRPQNFKEVVNQNHIKITLEHEIKSNNIAHAYLFCGPRAVGKTTLARVFAKSINCEQRKDGESEACNQCSSCQKILEGKSLNIIEMDAASHTGVDNVRDNIVAASRISVEKGRYKVFIIDEAHMLSIPAFNALLKTLEEPPERVVFILCTTEVHKVPNTIISRCQRFDFKKINVNDLTKKLQFICDQEGIKIEKNILESIARQSEGHMRDAESILGQVISIGGKEITQKEADLVIPRGNILEVINLLEALSRKDASQAIGILNSAVQEGIDIKKFSSDLIEILRKVLLSKVNRNLAEKLGLELGEEIELKLNNIIKDLNTPQLIHFIEKFLKAKEELKNSFIIQLPLELVIVELCIQDNSVEQNLNSFTSKKIKQNLNKPNNSFNNPYVKQDLNQERKIQTPQKNNNFSNKNININDIKDKWNEVLIRIKKYNHSLTFILRVCEPREIVNGTLRLAFKYKFHKNRIKEEAIDSIIRNVLNEVYGADLEIEAIVDDAILMDNSLENKALDNDAIEKNIDIKEKEQEEEKDDGDLMTNMLKTFGGKVVS